jgi:hypothetical protein
MTILKWILKKQSGRIWIELIWVGDKYKWQALVNTTLNHQIA